MRSTSIWLTAVTLIFMGGLVPATALGQPGFSAGANLSLTCNKTAYAYTGNTRQVTVTVAVSGETSNTPAQITLTGSGAPGTVTMPPTRKTSRSLYRQGQAHLPIKPLDSGPMAAR